jgi:hypothetical protein
MGVPVSELLSRISSKELTEWRAYFQEKKKLMDKDKPKTQNKNKISTF